MPMHLHTLVVWTDFSPAGENALARAAQLAAAHQAHLRVLASLPAHDARFADPQARLEQRARAKDPRVAQVMAGLASEYDVVLVARADGTLAADVRPLVRLSITVIAEQKGRREVGSAGGGGRFGLAYFSDEQITQYVDEAVSAALTNLQSRPAPAGEMTVVLGPGWPGVLLHEAVGHGLEGDFNRKGASAFSGRIGQRVAAKGVTVNTVSPGYIGTDMVRAIRPDVLEKIVATIPVKRLGRPEEIGSIVTWLAGEDAGFTTGADFSCNGGLHMG